MGTLLLADFHSRLGGLTVEERGGDVISDYGDPAAEHRALTESAAVLDLSSRGRLVLLGADRQKFLNGQVTQNVKDLKVGEGCYAALVNAKAKMVSDLNVHALANELLLDFEPGYSAAIASRLETFVLADDVQIVDAAPHYGLLSLQGPKSETVLASLGEVPNVPKTELGSTPWNSDAWGELYIVRHARFGSRGFDLYVPVTSQEALAARLLESLGTVSGRFAGVSASEVARVEAGVPRYGVDMDETHLPPETGIEARAISYNKGCYSGQEVIARIRTYGQVSKALRGLRLSGGAGALPVRGAKLQRDGKDVGMITSAVVSPRLGERIAMGYVRRECNQPGQVLDVVGMAEPMKAEVVPLPFVGPMLA